MNDNTEELELSADELAEFFADEEQVAFVVERTLGNGKVVSKPFVLIVDPNRIEAKDMATYRRGVAESAVRTDEIRQEARTIKPIAEAGDDEEVALDNVQSSVRELELQVQLFETNDDYKRASAVLLAKLVVGCDYPKKDFSQPDTLLQRVGAGPAALEALHIYFFGSSDEPEEEIGETPTPSTETASDTLEATDSSENTPPTS